MQPSLWTGSEGTCRGRIQTQANTHNSALHAATLTPSVHLQVSSNPLKPLQDSLPPLLAPYFEPHGERRRLQDDVTVRGLIVDGHLLPRPRARHLGHVERPQDAGARDEQLDVDDVRAQALAAAPAEGVHAELAVAEVGVLGQGLLVCWEGRVEPSVWPVGFAVGISLGNAVDGPGELCKFRSINQGSCLW